VACGDIGPWVVDTTVRIGGHGIVHQYRCEDWGLCQKRKAVKEAKERVKIVAQGIYVLGNVREAGALEE